MGPVDAVSFHGYSYKEAKRGKYTYRIDSQCRWKYRVEEQKSQGVDKHFVKGHSAEFVIVAALTENKEADGGHQAREDQEEEGDQAEVGVAKPEECSLKI